MFAGVHGSTITDRLAGEGTRKTEDEDSKRFNKEKGYRFISPGGEVFVYHSATQAARFKLNEGDRIEFEVTRGPKRFRAQNVVKP